MNPNNVQISGIFPSFAVQAGTENPRNELAIGALMPWAGKLWAITYIAHTGHNSGLYSIDKDLLQIERHPESIPGTFANRFMHAPSDSVIIGPHIIDRKGQVRTCKKLAEYRLAGTCKHLTDPDNKVYMLTMEGPFFELDVNTLETTEICNLTYELQIHTKFTPGWEGKAAEAVSHTRNTPQPHFKACHTGQGRVYVANNSYFEEDHLGKCASGRLVEWDGNEWKVIRTGPFNEEIGRAHV